MEPISTRCSKCDQPLSFPGERAGRKAKCTRCGAELTVPEPPPPAPPPPPPPPKKDDEDEDDAGPKHYGMLTDPTTEEKKKLPPAKKKKDKKPAAAVVKKKMKSLPEADKWGIVRHGLFLMAIGAMVWGAIFAMQCMTILIGATQGMEYNRVRLEVLMPPEDEPLSGAGTMGNVNMARFLIGLVAGTENVSLVVGIRIVLAFLTLVQIAFFMMGYFTCLQVPERFGCRGQVMAMIGLGGLSLLFHILFRLLPILGVMPYVLVPYFAPELPVLQANVERSLPLHVFWSSVPFWEFLLTFFVLGIQYMEYNMGVVFLQSIGYAIKEDRIKTPTVGLVQLGFGTLFALLCYYLLSIGGTTDVLVSVLRLNYLIWSGFIILFIVRYTLLLLFTRDFIDKLVKGEIAEEDEADEKAEKDAKKKAKDKKKKKKEEDEDEEADEEDEPPKKRKKK